MNKAAQDDDDKMMTCKESKKAFDYLYCKRRELDDKIHTKPLDLVFLNILDLIVFLLVLKQLIVFLLKNVM